jgi:hypothetical protein
MSAARVGVPTITAAAAMPIPIFFIPPLKKWRQMITVAKIPLYRRCATVNRKKIRTERLRMSVLGHKRTLPRAKLVLLLGGEVRCSCLWQLGHIFEFVLAKGEYGTSGHQR